MKIKHIWPAVVMLAAMFMSVNANAEETTMTNLINLQTSPTPANIQTEAVEFSSNGAILKGTLYKNTEQTGSQGVAIVTGAWTTVKEQMPGTYARELAARGITALAFDFTGWGESTGEPRYVEDPAVKTADIEAAADYLATRDDIDSSKIFGLGICASSGYMAQAVADNANFAKLALVAPWLHDPAMAEAVYGGPESVANFIASSEAEDPAILTAASTSDETSPMYQAPYYTETDRGLIEAYDNKFNALTWKPWLTYNALESAAKIDKPILMVGSAGMALPAGADAYEKLTSAPLEKLWLADDVSQFDFYDRADIVTESADAVADFFKGE